MTALELDRLVGAVQANCRIADARHARELPLCIYLLQMRELYRWERQLPFGAALDRQAVGSWLAQRARDALEPAACQRAAQRRPRRVQLATGTVLAAFVQHQHLGQFVDQRWQRSDEVRRAMHAVAVQQRGKRRVAAV